MFTFVLIYNCTVSFPRIKDLFYKSYVCSSILISPRLVTRVPLNIKLDNTKSPQMVAQILPDKCFVFIFYVKQKKNEQSLLHAVLYGQRVYTVYWGGYHGKT
jgi:hypothetical protein